MAILSVETKKISELEAASSCANNDTFVLDTALSGTQKATFSTVIDSIKSAMNVPTAADTLLANTSISTAYENEAAKVAASSTVYTAELRIRNLEKNARAVQGAIKYGDEQQLSDLLAAIRSNDPNAYCLGDYITASGVKWVVVAKNYYNEAQISPYKSHAVLMSFESVGNRAFNSAATIAGGYNSSALKTWLEGDFYNSLPSALRSAIIQPNVTESTVGDVITVARKIQLPGAIQIGGYNTEGEAFRICGPQFSFISSRFIAGAGGSSEIWTSTPRNGSTVDMIVMNSVQCRLTYGRASNSRAVRPIIVIG